MTRTPDGWRIERIVQHVGWAGGNPGAVAEAVARSRAKRGRGTATARRVLWCETLVIRL
ncbi:hypothetical protein [Nonomuraea jabiensis]|uniref:hypothetical protein n=1 Tax=Nonomuraea jabiensis TaxID=882448 RepID=UPI0036CD6234